MKQLPETVLMELVNLTEMAMRSKGGGSVTQNVDKIENLAKNLGYSVDTQEVRSKLVDKLSEETAKELRKQLGV